MKRRAVICFHQPFGIPAKQDLRTVTENEVRDLLQGLPLYAYAGGAANRVSDLQQYATTLGFPEVQFTGPLEQTGETLVIYPGNKFWEVADVVFAA